MKWRPGRQNHFYQVLRLYKIFQSDCYLIRYSEGCAVAYHSDDVPGYKHYRLNIQIFGKNSLCLLDGMKKIKSRFCFFRADKMHSFGVTRENGLILSFGLAIKDKSLI